MGDPDLLIVADKNANVNLTYLSLGEHKIRLALEESRLFLMAK